MAVQIKDIFERLANGENRFECQFNGSANECEILIIDMRRNMALVRFKNPVKKTIRKEVDSDLVWGLDRDDSLPMEDVEVESLEEWIAI